MVMVHGAPVVRDGRLLNADEGAIIDAASKRKNRTASRCQD